MANLVQELLANIREMEGQLEEELSRKRDAFHYRMERRRAVFEEAVVHQHRLLRTSLWSYVKNARILTILTAPLIYSMIIPFLLLDLFVTIYQAICFPIYGIAKVRRNDYVIFDRHRLNYLNSLEKLNCMYCSYGNGLIAFVREIAARTEQYWCPIKHAQTVAGYHQRYPEFAEFGDGENYQQALKTMRQKLAAELYDEPGHVAQSRD